MQFAFDLISDLHIETWDSFDWGDQPTAPYCIVAGDICRDRNLLVDTLTHLGQCYSAVFYIDGNDEHRYFYEDLGESYKDLVEAIQNIPNVVYMQDNVVIINGVAILATNGWWTYNFTGKIETEESQSWTENHLQISNNASTNICGVAYHDAAYLMNSVSKLQTHNDVKSIILVSHTLPAPWIIDHDIELGNQIRTETMGNQHLKLALDEDTENKVVAWCFGHYHKSVDQYYSGIRYVSNPRGRGNTPWSQPAYYPKRIEI